MTPAHRHRELKARHAEGQADFPTGRAGAFIGPAHHGPSGAPGQAERLPILCNGSHNLLS